MKFIEMQEKLINAASIISVEKPKLSGIDWIVEMILDSSKSSKTNVTNYYETENEAKKDYSRIVAQLCSDKNS